ncbi:DNA alkylation repair protein [Streptococcus pneumoniae]|uniref:DNA alkylation repair protein n=1 Tax=Streptococcus pneumoniae TaxID=1313 RepID=A0A559CT59_STREE|nr:DNA alkylation repair protein [Streptococcus pneumoniae]TMR44040.1 DNA alkylation repair protein [Streptococcus pseudopneumoniae]AVD76144.1 DNA alkylation repair protein [Streptococcus pneumoniae]AVV92389.1 DNA alkylation repair protein [Streptococcus pneumoniae]AXJ89406.1 DNA alkylation repair protein [Streptococcus pneumoniae]
MAILRSSGFSFCLILFENLFKPRQLCLAVLKYSLRLAS